MSKFQVGDYVRHVNSDAFDGRWHGPVEAIGGTTDGCQRRLWLGTGENVAADLFELVARAGEWVPDVDGNPIRVGQLVEDLDGALGWVEKVDDDEVSCPSNRNPLALLNGHWIAGSDLRVVDSTFRPPEPDTRDVQLLVKVPTEDPDANTVSDVRMALGQYTDDWHIDAISVEVVDTTDTGEGDA